MSKESATEEALVEAAIAALRENPASVPVDTLRSITEHGFSKEDLIGKPFEVADDDVIPVYSTYTGEPSYINTSMLKTVLRKRFTKDHEVPPQFVGKLAFSLDQKVTPPRGTIKCMLHPENPLRDVYRSYGIGMAVCMKDNLPDELNARMHAQHRHPQSWQIVQEGKAREREDEWREREDERRVYEREVMANLLELVGSKDEPKRGPGRPRKSEQGEQSSLPEDVTED